MSGDECRPVDIDGVVVRVRGEREMDATDRAALTEVIAAARRKLESDRCVCGWRPREGVIGGETMREHQALCSVHRSASPTST